MSYKCTLKGSEELGGAIGENEITLRRKESWIVGEGANISDFLVSNFPPKVGSRLKNKPWYAVKSAEVTKEIELPEGGKGVTLLITYSCPTGILEQRVQKHQLPDKDIFPWHLPLRNYKTAPVMLEQSMDHLWRLEGEGEDAYSVPTPFRTSAGTELTGTRQRPLVQVSFEYDLYEKVFKEEYLSRFQNTINHAPITIAGRKYATGQVLISGIGADMQQDDAYGFWWRINITFQIDPQTWLREYLNAGLYHRPGPFITYDSASGYYAYAGRPSRIWTSWRNVPVLHVDGTPNMADVTDDNTGELKMENGKVVQEQLMRIEQRYGSQVEMRKWSRENASEVTEPMMLFPEGWRSDYTFANGKLIGDLFDIGGSLLPFDKETGRQFLARVKPDEKNNRFADFRNSNRVQWWPVEWDEKKEDYVFIPSDAKNFNDRIINRAAVRGYPHKLTAFTDLQIPEHKGVRT